MRIGIFSIMCHRLTGDCTPGVTGVKRSVEIVVLSILLSDSFACIRSRTNISLHV